MQPLIHRRLFLSSHDNIASLTATKLDLGCLPIFSAAVGLIGFQHPSQGLLPRMETHLLLCSSRAWRSEVDQKDGPRNLTTYHVNGRRATVRYDKKPFAGGGLDPANSGQRTIPAAGKLHVSLRGITSSSHWSLYRRRPNAFPFPVFPIRNDLVTRQRHVLYILYTSTGG